MAPQQIEKGKVLFTYDVRWEESDIHWASRWDIYLSMNNAVPGKVHWFSIVTSVRKTTRSRRRRRRRTRAPPHNDDDDDNATGGVVVTAPAQGRGGDDDCRAAPSPRSR